MCAASRRWFPVVARFVNRFPWIAILLVLQLPVSGASEAPQRGPGERQVTVQTAGIRWTAGQRITLTPEESEATPDGQKALRVTLSGPPSPGDRYSKQHSLLGCGLHAPLAQEDAAAWVSTICFWFKALRPSDESLIFVLRPGYGDPVSLRPAGWRKVELRSWGRQPLTIREVEEIAIRTATAPDGSQFLLGPLTFEITDEATEAAKWKPANASPFTVNGLWWLKENGGAYCRLP